MQPKFMGFSAKQLASEPIAGFGSVKISIWSSQPIGPNARPRAWVGTQELQGLGVDQFGIAFDGYVANMPADTDTLSVQLQGDDKIDTELTMDADPPIV